MCGGEQHNTLGATNHSARRVVKIKLKSEMKLHTAHGAVCERFYGFVVYYSVGRARIYVYMHQWRILRCTRQSLAVLLVTLKFAYNNLRNFSYFVFKEIQNLKELFYVIIISLLLVIFRPKSCYKICCYLVI